MLGQNTAYWVTGKYHTAGPTTLPTPHPKNQQRPNPAGVDSGEEKPSLRRHRCKCGAPCSAGSMRHRGHHSVAQGAGVEPERTLAGAGFFSFGGFGVSSCSFCLGPAPCGEILFFVCPLSGPHLAGDFLEVDTSLGIVNTC